LHFDLPRSYPDAQKRELAAELGRLFADVMDAHPRVVNVAFRELGAGNVLRCHTTPPSEVVVVQCDIRRGRPPEQRAVFARALIDLAAAHLDWPADGFIVEFTEHAGDQMFRDGSLAPDWSPSAAPSDDNVTAT
jgi:phenylpyruvate tautomerase PptA (4-oxalocrotonate tautomerase family)